MKQQINWSLLQNVANPIADLITSNKNAAYAKQIFGSGDTDWNGAVRRLLAAGDVAGAAKVSAIAHMLEPKKPRTGFNPVTGQLMNMDTGEPFGGTGGPAFKPSPGYIADPNKPGAMTFIPGGPADPEVMRQQPSRLNTPPGYAWNDPANPEAGMHAIPGGPGEKIDSEVAGRLGMAKSFIGQVPELTLRIQSGEASGISGNAKGYAGIGGPGEIRRQIDSGADALLRMLTGAGMNKEEASDYVRRYRFDPSDGTETRLSKLNQLVRELQSVGETVGRGRGGISLSVPETRGIPGVQGAVPSVGDGLTVPDEYKAVSPVPGANYITTNPQGPAPGFSGASAKQDPERLRAWIKEAADAGVPSEMIRKRLQEMGYGQQ